MSSRFVMLICLLFLHFSSLGQLKNPPYKLYTLRDGLSQMQAISLFQDSRGYIWAGTKGGANYYNGENIISFTKKDGLHSEYIHQITEDNNGTIWFSTMSGFASFDGQKIIAYPDNNIFSAKIAATPDGKIWYIGFTPKNEFLFGYFERGEYFDKKNDFPEIDMTYHNYDIGFSEENNAIIIVSGNKLFEIKENRLKTLLISENQHSLIKQNSEIIIIEKSDKNQIEIWEYKLGKLNKTALINDNKIVGENLSTLTFSFCTYRNNSTINTIGPNLFKTVDFKELQVSNCLIDNDKHLWLSTEEGLCRVNSDGFETYKKEYLPGVWSIIEDRNKDMWFASFNFGIRKLSGEKLTQYSTDYLKPHGQNIHFQPSISTKGNLYFSNVSGIMYFDGKNFGAIKGPLSLATWYDKSRDLLYSGQNRCVTVYNSKHESIRKIDENDGLEIKGYVSSFGDDGKGNIWFGGFKGLALYKWENNIITNFTKEKGNLPCEGVLSIHKTYDETNWFGGTEGLLYYNHETKTINQVDPENINESVSLVNSIDSTWLVFSQSYGIYFMDLQKFKKEGKIVLNLFTDKNGFDGIEPGQNGAFKDSDGNLWMTTSTEVVKLNPRELTFNSNTFNIRIAKCNGELLPFSNSEINLNKNEKTAIVHFESICFNRPKKVQYSWRINKSDTVWTKWNEENYAVLTDLKDGVSILEVKARVPGIYNSEIIIKTPVFINLAIWKQQWFYPTLFLLVVILVLISIALLFIAKSRLENFQRQSRAFQLQAIISQMNPHFIFNVLASLQSMILSTSIEKANEYLVKMSGLIRGFLEASIYDINNGENDNVSELTLQSELQILNNFVEFQQLIYPDKFDFELYIDSNINTENVHIPPMLVQPFVENAIRHGLLQKKEKGLLKISVKKESDNVLVIDVIDNGIGMKLAGEMLSKSKLRYTSRGRELTLNRIKLLNESGYNIRLETKSSDSGTHIKLSIKN